MNRPIKFRAWNYSQYGEPGQSWSAAPNSMVPPEMVMSDLNKWLDIKDPDVRPMQFTGLLDKNGKEIYEGDILLCFTGEKYLAEIQWWKEMAGFVLVWHSKEVIALRGCDSEPILRNVHIDSEIIGNIYENPELIKS